MVYALSAQFFLVWGKNTNIQHKTYRGVHRSLSLEACVSLSSEKQNDATRPLPRKQSRHSQPTLGGCEWFLSRSTDGLADGGRAGASSSRRNLHACMTSDMHPVATPRDRSNAIALSDRAVGLYSKRNERRQRRAVGGGGGKDRNELKVRTTLTTVRAERSRDLGGREGYFSTTYNVSGATAGGQTAEDSVRVAESVMGLAGGQREEGSVVRVDAFTSRRRNCRETQSSTSLSGQVL